MRTKKLYFILLSFFLVFTLSCNQANKTGKDTPESTYKELERFSMMPDSLLTEEEIIKKEKLHRLVSEKVFVRDNQFYTTIVREDFTEIGLSEYYYDNLEKSIKETNEWVKKEGITNLDSMYRSSLGSFLSKKK